jgi:hypothetical protein
MVLPTPGRFSTITGTPQRPCSELARRRATISPTLAAPLVMIFTGLAG